MPLKRSLPAPRPVALRGADGFFATAFFFSAGFGAAFFTTLRATFFFGATLRFGAALRAPMYTAGDVAAAERTATCEASGAWKPAASAARQNSTIARSISM